MKNGSVGVAIGRFQTPYLHRGHCRLLDEVYRRHPNMCVVIGDHNGVPTDRYPLDPETRRLMILKLYQRADILFMQDSPSDEYWSEKLDEMLLEKYPDKKITLYGSRDSFLKVYSGKLKTRLVNVLVESKSSTEIRETECVMPLDSIEFRKGQIYGTQKRHPVVYPTVDVMIYRMGYPISSSQSPEEVHEPYVLLGKKFSDGGKLRIIGGFLDPKDQDMASAAKRELREEAGINLEIGPLEYVGSAKINDHRYRSSKDSVMTTMFCGHRLWGFPKAGDDLDEVHWIKLSELLEHIAPFHMEIALKFKDYLEKKFFNEQKSVEL